MVVAGVHRRDVENARRARRDQGPDRAQARVREAPEGARRRVREGPPRHPLPGVGVLPRRAVPAHRDARDPRRAPRLRARRARSATTAARIDNWEWPRHTGDWSFYRAYVGKDGKPADYSPDNVPYQPRHWLQVRPAGAQAGRLRDGRGLPGRRPTARAPRAEAHHDVEVFYPYLIRYYLKERYKLAEAHLGDGGETSIKATVLKQGIQNGLEKYQGMLQGFQKNPDLIAQKDELDKKLREWAAQPGHEEHSRRRSTSSMGSSRTSRRTQRADDLRTLAFHGSASSRPRSRSRAGPKSARKKDADRKPGLQDRDMPRASAGAEAASRQYDNTLDRASFRAHARARRGAARGRPSVARGAARHEEGGEDRRSADR